MPLPSIFSKIASLLKNRYDGKHTSKLHVALPPGIVSLVEKYIKSEVIETLNHKATCYISGRFDILVSFKNGNPSKESSNLLSHQLHAYAYALEHPRTHALTLSTVTKSGLLYFYPFF